VERGKKEKSHNQQSVPYRFSGHIQVHSLALVGFGKERVFVGFLCVPALTRDSRGCFVDFAPVILSTTPKTVSGVAGAKTALGRLGCGMKGE